MESVCESQMAAIVLSRARLELGCHCHWGTVVASSRQVVAQTQSEPIVQSAVAPCLPSTRNSHAQKVTVDHLCLTTFRFTQCSVVRSVW